MKTYVDFEVRIAPGPTDYMVYATGPGGNESGTFAPPGDPAFAMLLQQLADFSITEDGLIQIGQQLFRALFHDKIKSAYDRAQAQAEQHADQGLRLRLNIDPQETAVTRLPWELLNDPDRGPLAMLDAPVVRFIPQLATVPSLKATLPLKVLLTAAQTPPPADVARELAEVQTALERLGDMVQITVEPHLTTRKFQRLLRENFHVWHFVGHGGFSPDGRTARLVLEDDSGGRQTIGATELQIFLNRNSIRLVVLDACESGTIAVEPFRSIAPALIRAQIPAVVAMQFNAPEDSTQAFASEFYRALAEGMPIDACVTEGRRAIMSVAGFGSPDWGIPVVYTRAPDGQLFELPASAAEPQPASQAGGVTQHGGVNINVQGSSLTNSPVSVSNVGMSAEDRAREAAALNDEIQLMRRRLYALQKQKALYGISADPAILIQIEDLQKEISALEQKQQATGG